MTNTNIKNRSLMGKVSQGIKKIWGNPSGRSGLILVLLMLGIAAFASVISPYDPLVMSELHRLEGPSLKHLMGTDEFGRDILSRIFYGARLSIQTGVISVIFAAFVGINIGIIAGYCGRWFDSISMRLMDAIISFPATLLAVVMIAIMGTGPFSAMFAIGIVNIPSFARLARANVLTEKNKGYVEAAHSIGSKKFRIMYFEIFPNILSTLFVQITVSIANAILLESALSFLGLGAPPPAPSWGAMLNSGKNFLLYSPTYAIFPGIALTMLITGLYLLGDGLRDIQDPRSSKTK